jgi:hypothetical protein
MGSARIVPLRAVLTRLEPGRRHLVTVGFDCVVFAERVEP